MGSKRYTKLLAAAIAGAMLAGTCSLAGCSPEGEPESPSNAANRIRIATMPTEDILPLWVAESEGISSEDGTQVEVVTFDSAQALSAAMTSGDVDMAMTDIMRAAKLTESGVGMTLEWIALGETADQGRFGILAPADAPYSNLQELSAYMSTGTATQGVGVGANTVPEYVFDVLCEQSDVIIPVQEVASLPDRYSLVASGQLSAAALPASLLALGEASGMQVIADDTQYGNISQSVIIARTGWEEENPQSVLDVAEIWDTAVEMISANPDGYRELLAEKANLNSAIAGSYPVSTYPLALKDGKLAHPNADLVQPVLEWMAIKSYGGNVIYDGSNGKLEAA